MVTITKTDLITTLIQNTIHDLNFDVRNWSLSEVKQLESVARLIRRKLKEMSLVIERIRNEGYTKKV